ncbi:ATP-binding protein [Dactylosporangium roseum]|uniref:ATP-binding protein n=1 Tax=Dactylosporangium roseum TaxID=47989 RepID=A0ABY5ZBQ6_9ACTN|nr:ATP-binding protein [Dactylosporangium roseum]UWZ39489.1 ATP-binding protein [Dactylosporangium roseum]
MHADPILVRQLLDNLIGNAVRHRPAHHPFMADELIIVPFEHAAGDRIRTLRLVAGAYFERA